MSQTEILYQALDWPSAESLNQVLFVDPTSSRK